MRRRGVALGPSWTVAAAAQRILSMAEYEHSLRDPAPAYPPRWAEKYVGLPYVVGGRTLAGIDCWGLASLVLEQEFGRPPFPIFGAEDTPEIRADALHVLQHALRFVKIKLEDADVADIVEMTQRGRPHCGLVVARGWMPHTRAGADSSVIERYDRDPWTNAIHTVWRYRGI